MPGKSEKKSASISHLVTRHLVQRLFFLQKRLNGFALLDANRTTGFQTASRGRIDRKYFSLQGRSEDLRGTTDRWVRSQERFGIGMQRCFEDVLYGSDFHHLAGVHDTDYIRQISHHIEVVGYKDQAELQLALQALIDSAPAPAPRHPRKGHRFIGDDQFRVGR